MNAKYNNAVMDLFNYDGSEREERIEAILEREGVTVEGVVATVNEMLWGNDVEGATIGIAAINLTYPDHDADEYIEACNRILDQCCPLLKLQSEDEFPPQFDRRACEMRNIIFDGAERIAAGHTLGI
jgi:hypothetical protein